MYRLGSEEVVSIGVTSKKRCDKVDPTLSRVGGVGSVHDVLGKPSELLCRRCGKADGMVLLTQLFAPFDLDRSLYVYACTNEGCASSSDGWLVFRNEAKVNPSEPSLPSPPQSAAPAKVAPPPPVAAMKAASSAWSFDDAGNGDDNIDNLLAMLEVRDKSLEASQSAGDTVAAVKQIPSSNATTTSKPAEKIDETRLVRTRKVLPCYEIEDFEEDWDAALEHTEEDDLTVKVDDAHVHRLLETYFRDEEDREHVDKLQQQFQSRPGATGARPAIGDTHEDDEDDDEGDGDGDDDSDDDDDDDDERPTTKKKSGAAGKATNATATTAAAGGAAKGRGGKGPSSSTKIERYFHRRVSRHPRQVLRYAYGGSPLWSSALPPLTTGSSSRSTTTTSSSSLEDATRQVAPCPWCRKARVFEFQLMPGLLSVWPSCAQLPTAARGASSASAATTAATAAEVIDLDFGVVAVFTCPDSCAPPAGQVAYECVLVQPAIDSVTTA